MKCQEYRGYVAGQSERVTMFVCQVLDSDIGVIDDGQEHAQ